MGSFGQAVAHARRVSGRVDAWRQHEPDVVAVNRLAGQANLAAVRLIAGVAGRATRADRDQ